MAAFNIPTVRTIAHWQFEDGGRLEVTLTGSTPLVDALDLLEELIAIHRKQLEKAAKR